MPTCGTPSLHAFALCTCVPALGTRYRAPWGRYVVHRVMGGKIVLKDEDRPGAAVLPTLDDLEGKYTRVANDDE